MTDAERDILIEQVLSAHREADPRGGLKHAPQFYDLEAADRVRAYDESIALRRLEAGLDPRGRSTTVHAVLRALSRASPEPEQGR